MAATIVGVAVFKRRSARSPHSQVYTLYTASLLYVDAGYIKIFEITPRALHVIVPLINVSLSVSPAYDP